VVYDILDKDPPDRSEEDIEVLLDFLQNIKVGLNTHTHASTHIRTHTHTHTHTHTVTHTHTHIHTHTHTHTPTHIHDLQEIKFSYFILP